MTHIHDQPVNFTPSNKIRHQPHQFALEAESHPSTLYQRHSLKTG